ncbi:MAG: hypothetical protein IPJ74_01750 [Saprospiraceae bacterium]|nr:hypothetical protein [Saprospiraceae bacterium]
MSKRTSGRIKLPINPKDILDLAHRVYQKHLADGKASLLNNLDGNTWETIGPNISIAQAKHQEAEEHKRKMEEAYRERDKYLPSITDLLRATIALLKAVFRQNPKRLGEWSFEVDDSTQGKKNDPKG